MNPTGAVEARVCGVCRFDGERWTLPCGDLHPYTDIVACPNCGKKLGVTDGVPWVQEMVPKPALLIACRMWHKLATQLHPERTHDAPEAMAEIALAEAKAEEG
jgi:hypothetical protein